MANTIIVQQTPVTVISDSGNDYICLTDMAGAKHDDARAADVIKNWLRNRNTIEYLGMWEMLNNLDFNPIEFEGVRSQAGLNAFTLSPSRHYQ